MNLPWKKKDKGPAVTATTPLGQIRQLYTHYQKQSNLWGYTLLSSMALICFWVLFSVLTGAVDYTYLTLPVMGIGVSAWQMRRIKSISGILRNAHEVQQQIDKAEAEKKAREEEEAAKQGKKPNVETNGAAGRPAKEQGAEGEEEAD